MVDRSEFDETRSRRLRSAALKASARTLSGERDDHPSYEALASIADDTADDVVREIVESHTAICLTCEAELDDLREFAGRKPSVPSRYIWWATAAAAALIAIVLGARVRQEQHPAQMATTTPIASGWQSLVAKTLRNGRVEMPADIRALGADDAYRGAPPAGSVHATVSPAGIVIDDLQPTLRWSVAGADDYEVALYQDGNEIARSPRQTATSWLCPRPLERGMTYRWQVTAYRGSRSFIIPSPPAPPALFRVLDAAEHDELARATAQRPNDDLLLGILYARAGLLDRARMHLARSPAGQKLLGSIDSPR